MNPVSYLIVLFIFGSCCIPRQNRQPLARTLQQLDAGMDTIINSYGTLPETSGGRSWQEGIIQNLRRLDSLASLDKKRLTRKQKDILRYQHACRILVLLQNNPNQNQPAFGLALDSYGRIENRIALLVNRWK